MRRIGSAVDRQQRQVPKNVALLSSKRLRGCRGESIAKIGLEERAEADAGRAQAIEPAAQAQFIAHATDDEGRMFVIGREKSSGGFQTGMAGLHHLLRMAQVAADQDVDMRSLSYLVEHDKVPPFCRKTTIASGGT